ncbi:MAG: DUF3658 domain-containing protein [Hyphomicrobiaceae bacterium]|nr:DUF3658 domain-containing protein [Hyphomicrobiaceae bacterium]
MTDRQLETGAAVADALDAIVLACADSEWRKVALFIARVVDAAKSQSLETTGQAVAARIYALVDRGELEAKGNVRRWRAGEVRKPG